MIPAHINPIETAPMDDRWLLGFCVEHSGRRATLPWVLMTRCDGGWMDEDAYGVTPVGWVPLPDPQPAGTGWAPAVGVIRIAPIIGGVIKGHWMVYIRLPDGKADLTREPDIAATFDEAIERARKLAGQVGLTIDLSPDQGQQS